MNFRKLLMGKTSSRISPSELQDLTKRTYFDEDELKQWYAGFIRGSPAGRMNQEQFVELYSGFYKTAHATTFAEHVFRTFDINGDGTIGKN